MYDPNYNQNLNGEEKNGNAPDESAGAPINQETSQSTESTSQPDYHSGYYSYNYKENTQQSNDTGNSGYNSNYYGYTDSTNNQSYYGANHNDTGSSYTWNTGNNLDYTNGYGAPAPKKEKKKKGGAVKRAATVIVACLLTSVFSVGMFAFLIQNGTINVTSQDSPNAAYTINKVLDDSGTTTTNTSNDTASTLSVQEVSEKILPSVVLVQNYQNTTSQGSLFGGYYRYNYGYGTDDTEDASEVDPASEGSGIIYSADGYIVTNAHVVSGADKIKVVTYDGQTYEAELVGSDSETDLAVLKINPDTELTAAEFGASSDLTVGDQVVAVGNPSGSTLSSSVTVGYVSALNREITNSSTGYTMNYIQTDAAINPGNSGGALVNMYGQVIGINTAKVSATGYEGLGFSIPTDDAQSIVSDLVNYGYVKDRAMMGISIQSVDSTTASFYGISAGWYVNEITSTEASNSGLQRADVITAIDGVQITASSSSREFLKDKSPGDTIELTVSRVSTGQTLTISLTLSESTGVSTTANQNGY